MGDSPCLPGILHLLDTPSEQQTAASLTNTLARSELEHLTCEQQSKTADFFTWELNKTVPCNISKTCLSFTHDAKGRWGQAIDETQEVLTYLSCHETVARKRLATG